MAKRKRDKKISKGENGGGGKVRLTEIQKALLGKGTLARLDGMTTERWSQKFGKKTEETV